MRTRPYGDRAVLVELACLEEVLALTGALRALAWPGVVDVVPAATTVLVVTEPGVDVGPIALAVRQIDLGPAQHLSDGTTVTIEVDYDGADLGDVAGLTGLSEAEVVAAHTSTPWRVAFAGFAPGFAYLAGGDPRLEVPRRDQSRLRVPAGAVGLAGSFSGVYPRSSPGGWQLIGRTDTVLWDLGADPPALLRPGCSVQFVERR